MVIFQTVLTAVSETCGSKWDKGLYCVLKKVSKLNGNKYLQN